MGTVDIDALLAAKREAQDEDRPDEIGIIFRGENLRLPDTPDVLTIAEATESLQTGDIAAVAPAFRALLGEESYARLKELRPGLDELQLIAQTVMELYTKVSPGESSASSASSPSTGKRSRRTSSGSTRSTSRGSSSGRRRSG
jgi:hypothetical protein